MLIPQGCLRSRVAEPSHDLLRAGARRGRDGARDVAQVVQMQVRPADRRARNVPLPLPDARAQRCTALADEHERVWIWRNPTGQMVLENGYEFGR